MSNFGVGDSKIHDLIRHPLAFDQCKSHSPASTAAELNAIWLDVDLAIAGVATSARGKSDYQ